MQSPIFLLPPNRVRRNCRGGAELDRLEGKTICVDNDQTEDWIASTVRARNPGMPEVIDEGLAKVKDADGAEVILRELFGRNPEYYLGRRHFEDMGAELGFLLKLLDPLIRLNVQAHPTAQFAQEHLNSRWGKLETYVILSVREPGTGYIRLGFQRPPGPAEWKRIVLEQDFAAMDACFDPVPVAPGEVWVVPGGLPHALGEGVLVLETMEPTDLVVRCEFEREGIVVPPPARFMGRDPDLALQIFDHTQLSVQDVRDRYCVQPSLVRQSSGYREEQLIGPGQTDCFEVLKLEVGEPARLDKNDRILIGVVINGAGAIEAQGESIAVTKGLHFAIAAAASEVRYQPQAGQAMTILLCQPGMP